MKIVVVGSNGQVGYELCQLANSSLHDIVCFERNRLDVSNEQQIREVLLAEMPVVVINATAYTAVDKAEEDTEAADAVNATAPGVMAAVCEELGAALMHISTDYVFAGDSTAPYVETDPVAPTGAYGASKLAGEQAVANACKRHIILRTAWVFGVHGNSFVKTMLRVAAGRDTLGVVADQFGAPTSARGIANTLMAIANHIAQGGDIKWGVYHYSGSPFTSWHGFAEVIFEEAAKRNMLPHAVTVNAITTDDYPTPAKRPANSRLDCSKLMQEFGIVPDDWHTQLNLVLDTL